MPVDAEAIQLASTSLATVLSLVGQFRSERAASARPSIHDFTEFLMTRQQQRLVALLERNQKASDEIAALLSLGHAEVSARLNAIDEALANLTPHVAPELADLARATHPEAVFSGQARSLLSQMAANTHEILILVSDNRPQAHAGNGVEYVLQEPEFLDEDVQRLLDFGLIRASRVNDDDYALTREGLAQGRRLLESAASSAE